MNIIGIDIGGTSIKGGIFKDDKLECVASVDTCSSGGRSKILASLFSLIDKFNNIDIDAIGIVSAGVIDPNTGICTYANDNLPGWTGLNIKKTIEDKYKIPCYVENDAIGHLLGELDYLKEKNNVVMLTLGTGVGGACLYNGKILHGKENELGHLTLIKNGLKCPCGKNGCAEAYLSATALYKEAKILLPNLQDCKELFDLYRNKNDKAVQIFKSYKILLNKYIDLISEFVHPKIIILGGGLCKSKDVIKELLDKHTCEIVFPTLMEKAGIYGALKLVKMNKKEKV